jgi:hypothetical protein
MDLFSKIAKIKSFEFVSNSGKDSLTGWSGCGNGKITVKQLNNKIFFKEHGLFKLTNSTKALEISNEYIWEMISNNKISLSHARFGYNHLVKLFDLIMVEENLWQSEQEHVCVDDKYSAKLEVSIAYIKLTWKILGPKKDERISYKYYF